MIPGLRTRLGEPRAQALLAVTAGLGLLALLVALHLEQRATYAAESLAFDRLRQAQLDLAQGFAHVGGGRMDASALDQDQGLALLRQASLALETPPALDTAGGAAAVTALRADAKALRERLDTWPTEPEPDPRHVLELRLAVDRVDVDASVVSAELGRALRTLADRQSSIYLGSLAIALGLLASAGMLLVFTGRAARSAARTHALALDERRRSEERERETAELLRAFAEGVSDALFVKDRDGRYLFANEAALRRLDRSREAVIGADSVDLFGEETGATMIARDELVIVSGAPMDGEEEVPRGDGRETWHVMRAPYRDEMGRIIGVLGIARNITERKEMERSLREELDRLASFAASAPGALFSLRYDRAGWFSLPYASARIEEIVGLAPTALVDDAAAAFSRIHPDDVAPVRDAIAAASHALSPWCGELRIRHPERGERWIEGHAVPTREADGSTLWHGFLTDITARRTLEDQLRHAQRMEAVGRLAGGVAHDFNNLLTVINTYAGFLVEGDTGDPAALLEAATAIQEAGERAAGLTAQLLAFSRKAIVAATTLDLSDRVCASQRLLARLLGEDIRLTTTHLNGPLLVRADPGQLDQVIVNLAVNARDAMPQGGQLHLETRRCVLEEPGLADSGPYAAGTYAELRVTDTGVGIEGSVRSKIFEPFFTTKGLGRGTGLGLSVVHGIVSQAGGHIVIESEPGRGATFRVRLPALAATTENTVTPDALPADALGTETVIVAEDEDGVRRLVERILTQYGYTVLATESGDAALEALRAHPHADALLCDVVMPGLNGRELIAAARAARPGLRVLMMTGYTDDEMDRRGVLEAGDALIQKPFAPIEVVMALRRVLDGPAR